MAKTKTANPVATPFGFESTATEVAAGVDLSGKRAVVTGAASGIGVETARALAGAGAGVTLAVRDLEAGARVAADIVATTGNADVAAAHLELTDRASIDAFTRSWEGPLHVLVNNAGVMAIQELQLTPEGYEMQFATNHLGHFALALGLHDALAGELERALVLAGDLRGHPLPLPSLRAVHRLRAVEDRECPVRRGGHAALGRGRDRGQRADARRDLHEPPAPRGPG
jgi:hypothetical protein